MRPPAVAVAGCTGTIGRLCVAAVMRSSACRLSGGILRPAHPGVGEDAGTLAGRGPAGVAASDDAAAVVRASRAIIDFSVPAATARHATLAAEHGAALVAATTGLDGTQEAALRAAAERTAIFRAPNMSPVNAAMTDAVERVARLLDEDYDIEVLDQVHRRKRDVPSGTARAIGRAAARGRGTAAGDADPPVPGGELPPRRRGAIGFATTRGGEAGGVFSVFFQGDHDALEITHRVHRRELYAAVALRAALWAIEQPPGLYGMMDLLRRA